MLLSSQMIPDLSEWTGARLTGNPKFPGSFAFANTLKYKCTFFNHHAEISLSLLTKDKPRYALQMKKPLSFCLLRLKETSKIKI